MSMKRNFSTNIVHRAVAYSSVTLLTLFGIAKQVAAQGGGSSKPVQSPLPIGAVSVPVLIGRIINGFLGITGVLAMAIFVYAGFVMMTAQGNSQKFDQGKKTMFWAGIGLMGVFASYAVVKFVIEALGADKLSG